MCLFSIYKTNTKRLISNTKEGRNPLEEKQNKNKTTYHYQQITQVWRQRHSSFCRSLMTRHLQTLYRLSKNWQWTNMWLIMGNWKRKDFRHCTVQWITLWVTLFEDRLWLISVAIVHVRNEDKSPSVLVLVFECCKDVYNTKRIQKHVVLERLGPQYLSVLSSFF